MTIIPSLEPTYLTMLCDAFVSMEDMLTDNELGALIVSSGIQDINHHATRHRRLLTAITNDQDHYRCADNLSTFLQRTGYHIRKSRGDNAYKRFLKEVNQVLSFAGYELNGDAKLTDLDKTKTTYVPPEAEERSQEFRRIVKQQKLHPDIELACRAEYFVEKGYHRAVRENMRFLLEKIKAKAVIGADGPEIAERAFAFAWPGKPVLAINGFKTERDLAEQFTFMCLLKAFFIMFQDEQTRAYRAEWDMSIEDAMNLLNLASYFHRKVDKSKKIV